MSMHESDAAQLSPKRESDNVYDFPKRICRDSKQAIAVLPIGGLECASVR